MRKGEAWGNAPAERPVLLHGFILRLFAAANNRQLCIPTFGSPTNFQHFQCRRHAALLDRKVSIEIYASPAPCESSGAPC
jgi:hypothetical protein